MPSKSSESDHLILLLRFRKSLRGGSVDDGARTPDQFNLLKML